MTLSHVSFGIDCEQLSESVSECRLSVVGSAWQEDGCSATSAVPRYRQASIFVRRAEKKFSAGRSGHSYAAGGLAPISGYWGFCGWQCRLSTCLADWQFY